MPYGLRWWRAGPTVPGAGLGPGVAVRRGRGRRGIARVRRADADAGVARAACAGRTPTAARHGSTCLQPQRGGWYRHNPPPYWQAELYISFT